MKKVIIFLLTILCIPFIVNAKEIINKNNVSMGEDIYSRLVELYSKNYIDNLSLEGYNYIMSVGLDNIEVVSSKDNLVVRSSTAYNVRLVKANSDIVFMVTWNRKPLVMSYDVIGIRNSGNLNAKLISFLQCNNGNRDTSSVYYRQSFNNGFGLSFPLLTSSSTEIIVKLQVSGSGTLYATYQHATKLISLNNSKKYTISEDGYGKVLKFDNSVKSTYDNTNGLSINI